jgi:glucose-1-phosphate cytidylyltransferase
MATYGDGVSDVNISALLDFHARHGKMVTVTGVLRPASYFGELKSDGDRVVEFFEKPQIPGFINGGYYVFNRRIFDYLNDTDGCDLEYGPLEQVVKEGQLMVYKHTGFWACMDTLRDHQNLEKLWNSGKKSWKVW